MQLYDYQLLMKRQLGQALCQHQSVMVQMPTGTGKTCVLTAFVAEWLSQHEGQVWIVAHRRELVEQITDTWHRTLAQLDCLTGAKAVEAARVKVYSIQWLTRHYAEQTEAPSLIVIDEAHHAVANTYARVMHAYPKAKKVGVTATPCRLNGQGFTDLFECLLTSHSVQRFITEGRLADFDYVSLSPTSDDQRRIDSLKKRAVDGDYAVAEMQAVLDTKPTLHRLCQTIQAFAPHKKGIVYAINIAHAEHIAAYYNQQGIKAAVVSSHTATDERARLIAAFKGLKEQRDEGPEVLVNVDLFGEGFDCPDVEFVQLARPTLSLAKYLQMVGRGLRTAPQKECCVVLDNVGLYRLFGLPTTEWNWQALFLGQQQGRGEVSVARSCAMQVVMPCCSEVSEHGSLPNDAPPMVVIARHNDPQLALKLNELQQQLQHVRSWRTTQFGYRSLGYYLRTVGNGRGLYRTTNDVCQGWRVVSTLLQGITHYYLLNEATERLVHMGRHRPLTTYADGVCERYAFEGSDLRHLVPVEEADYIIPVHRRPLADSVVQCDKWGNERLVTYVYYGLNRSRSPWAYSKDAYVCKHFEQDEYAICNNHHHIILRGLKRVRLHNDNIAEVVYVGEEQTRWVNLYTLQEFDERPIVEKSSLRVGNIRFSYKDRRALCVL